MKLPDFFDQIPRLRVQDPLARMLGYAEAGVLEYSYGDAVRLAGHSCLTVAAAYWMTWRALERLYADCLPQRGGIKVEFREDARTLSTGVVASVVQMLTGAAGGSGFKGISGRFGRVGLMRFSPEQLLPLRFTRLDTRVAVEATVDVTLVPADPAIEALLPRCIANKASPQEERMLGALWQEQVRHLLLDLARDPAVFVLRDVERKGAIRRDTLRASAQW